MSNHAFRHALAFIAAIALMLIGAQALADQYYIKSSAAVYGQPSESAERLGTLKPGTKVDFVAEKKGWAKIEKNGAAGYIKASSLLKVEDVDNLTAYTVSATPMYKSFSSGSKKLGTIPAGKAVTVSARAEGLAYVSYQGTKGYVQAENLTLEAPTEPESTPAPTPEPQEDVDRRTVYVAREGAKVYNAGGKAIGTLGVNTELTLTGVKGKICRVEYGGRTAYMYKRDLSTEKVSVDEAPEPTATPEPEAPAEKTAYVNKDGAKAYNERGKVIATLALNTRVTITATRKGICRVQANGSTFYMKSGDLSEEKVQDPSEKVDVVAYVRKDKAKVFDEKGKVTGTLDAGTEVRVKAVKGEFCRVVVKGDTAYMRVEDLTTEKPKSPEYTLKLGDTGEAVKRVQSRLKELGYYSGSINGEYNEMTQNAVMTFQTVAKLKATGIVDDETLKALFSDDAPKRPEEKKRDDAPTGESTVTPAKGTAREMDWWTSDIQSIFARGVTAQITDVETGLSWLEQRRGGTNHADCQPLTAADTAALKRAYGGVWSWKRRAIFVTINGVNYAASMNGMPHGSGSIDGNDFNGHHCIHFTNSRTHGGNKVCELHQAMIKKAASTTLH